VSHIDRRILDAAGIHDPDLRAAYSACRRLHAQFGRTYYLATLLLPPAKRPYVHALYGFARYADQIVDVESALTRAEHFRDWAGHALAQLSNQGDTGGELVTLALAHTLRRWDIPLAHVSAFLDSMRQDLTVTGYETFDDLRRYMYGSAAVIGLQMTPILEPVDEEAYPRAAALGEAFQLTNFIRDVGEDLHRGRVYLPREDLQRFGVNRDDLSRTTVPPRVRELLRFEIARTRDIYAYAAGGIQMLCLTSRPCIDTAYRLYSGILDAVEAAGYDILHRRVSVGVRRRLRVAVPAYVRARRLRGAAATPTAVSP
jgi:phytoene synthase